MRASFEVDRVVAHNVIRQTKLEGAISRKVGDGRGDSIVGVNKAKVTKHPN